jgi:TctA family transporter
VEVVLLAVVLLSVLTILVKSQRLNLPASNPYIFLACTIGALIIPAVSNDYKLPLLAGPMAIFMQQPLPHIDGKLRAVLFLGIKFTASIAYALTLFSYTNKPLFLQNNLPVLLWILLAATIMVILEKPSTHSPDKTSAQTDTP